MLDEEYNKTRDINYKVRILVEIKERQKNIFIIDQKIDATRISIKLFFEFYFLISRSEIN